MRLCNDRVEACISTIVLCARMCVFVCVCVCVRVCLCVLVSVLKCFNVSDVFYIEVHYKVL